MLNPWASLLPRLLYGRVCQGNSPTLGRGGSKPDLGVDTNAPQRDLLLALERREIVEVRNAMSRIPEGKQKAVLLAPRYAHVGYSCCETSRVHLLGVSWNKLYKFERGPLLFDIYIYMFSRISSQI